MIKNIRLAEFLIAIKLFMVVCTAQPLRDFTRFRRSRCSGSDFAYSYPFFRGVVCLSFCRLSYSCTLLKPFDGFTCHLADTLRGAKTRGVRWGVPNHQGKGKFGGRTLSQILHLLTYDSPGGQHRSAISRFTESLRPLVPLIVGRWLLHRTTQAACQPIDTQYTIRYDR